MTQINFPRKYCTAPNKYIKTCRFLDRNNGEFVQNCDKNAKKKCAQCSDVAHNNSDEYPISGNHQ